MLRAPRPEHVPIRVAAHVPQDSVLTLSVRRVEDDHDGIYLQLHCVDGTWQPSKLPIYPGEYRVRCRTYAGSDKRETTWKISKNDSVVRWLMR